jgi:hypothetical protein
MPAQPNPRPKVLWFGPSPDQDVHEFKNRNLVLEINAANPENDFRFARAAIFKFDPEKQRRLITNLRTYAATAIDNGLTIMLIADDDTGQNGISHALTKFSFSDECTRRTHPPMSELAENAARHHAGPEDNPGLKISREVAESLSVEQRLLFRRAFWDCRGVVAQPLDGGRSGNVFCVYATFRDSEVGPRPLPFFVKIDLKHKILSELNKYKIFTEHFIPFSSRPNLDHSRCFVGSSHGIIVGNFVEHSETLWDLAIRGHANKAIHSLFDEALRGWHLQAYQENSSPRNGNLYAALNPAVGELVRAEEFTQQRVKDAFSLGATLKPDALVNLARSMPPVLHRSAPIHGDLHAKNVRVRNSDAILIDFYLTRIGPIAADPASLEATLLFSAVDEEDKYATWRKTVDALFKEEYLEHAPPPAKQPHPREWLWNCVRQIRLVALGMQTSKFEYAAVLGIYSLRCAMFKADYPEEELRRAYAYVLAERLLKLAAKEHSSK